MTSKQKPLDKAVAYLKLHITNGDWQKGKRLPTCKALAREADVGGNTMLAALSILKSEGLISYKTRQGIFVGPAIPVKELSKPQTPIPKWEYIKERIKKEVLSGIFFETDIFPSVKELCVRYATDFYTIKKAIDALVAEEFLLVGKRGYRIQHNTSKTTGNTIYLFVNELVGRMELWGHDKDAIFFLVRKLEQECHARSIVLKKHWYGSKDTIENLDVHALGFIVLNSATYQEPRKTYTTITKFLTQLKQYKKPISFISIVPFRSSDKTDLDRFCTDAGIFTSQSPSNLLAGERVGKFLLSKGHKKACFFGHTTKDKTWTDRYEGLCKAYDAAGLHNAITPFFPLDSKRMTDSVKSPEKYPCVDINVHTLIDDLFHAHGILSKHPDRFLIKPDFLDSLIHEQHELTKRARSHALTTSVPISIGTKEFEFVLANTYRLHVPPLYKQQLVTRLHEMMNNYSLLHDYYDAFRMARAQKDTTAWVCVEDYLTNYAALQFLLMEKIEIPKQIGLIGFQDQAESSFNDISSYCFDWTRAAIKALNIILYPKHAEKTLCIRGTRIFEVDGMVIDRGSV